VVIYGAQRSFLQPSCSGLLETGVENGSGIDGTRGCDNHRDLHSRDQEREGIGCEEPSGCLTLARCRPWSAKVT
jgi:hypothetical protein